MLMVFIPFTMVLAENEKFDPATYNMKTSPETYEDNMKTLYSNVTAKDAENLRLCKRFAEKGKEYKALNRSDKFYDVTVKNCEKRVRRYCGVLWESVSEEANQTK